MAAAMKATFKVEVAGASTMSAVYTLQAEAFDRIDVTVPAEASGTPGSVTVEVQPGGAGQVALLFITSASFPHASDGSPELTYDVDGGGDRSLDGPLLLAGPGSVELLGAVNQIVFSNASDTDLAVHILVGRDATS